MVPAGLLILEYSMISLLVDLPTHPHFVACGAPPPSTSVRAIRTVRVGNDGGRVSVHWPWASHGIAPRPAPPVPP